MAVHQIVYLVMIILHYHKSIICYKRINFPYSPRIYRFRLVISALLRIRSKPYYSSHLCKKQFFLKSNYFTIYSCSFMKLSLIFYGLTCFNIGFSQNSGTIKINRPDCTLLIGSYAVSLIPMGLTLAIVSSQAVTGIIQSL